ncbi:secondary thiamine-phosphate synthase enzyme YjbQ [Desulfovibrio sp. OttesenSCG-928-C06]|nr:secondary thiamine-phosphate synthase enzyme YjbQ [Desulfovibrio sp. OttesenSCG-928-C06]
MESLKIKSSTREQFIDITNKARQLVSQNNWRNGALMLFCPHTTAALTINEAADPSVASDMTAFLRKLIPQDAAFRHLEGNSDAHIKSSLIGPDLMLIVEDGEICLGTWQGIYLYEGDGPRTRNIWARFLKE